MSRTTVYAIDAEGWVREIGEAYCAPAFFPGVWTWLGAKYGVPPEFPPPTPTDDPYYGQKSIEGIWKLARDSRLTHHQRLLLLATFDGVWFKRERAGRFIDAVGEYISEWARRRRYLPCAAECSHLIAAHYQANPTAMGYCFRGTSVSESYWLEPIPLGTNGQPLVGNGEATEYDYRPLNITTTKRGAFAPNHFEVGEAWPALNDSLDSPSWRMPTR